MLMAATDGIQTREQLVTPVPRETGTDHVYVDADGKGHFDARMGKPKPLGGWEEKEIKKGVFYARPGIYFPMNPSAKEVKTVRGRGVGKKVILKHWQHIVDFYEAHKEDLVRGEDKTVRIAELTRFCGAKTSIHARDVHEPTPGGGVNTFQVYSRADGGTKVEEDGTEHELPKYGQWIRRPVDMGFKPWPKREKILPDGTMTLRRISMRVTSTPYEDAMSEEALELRACQLEASEQPDADLNDYE
jgi:hypothetical protein